MLKKAIALTCAGATLITSTGCSVVGIRTTPEPSYQVLQENGDFELRQYPALLVASTVVTGDFETAGDRAFRPLFNYITGDNKDNTEISMTAPVISEAKDGQEIAMTAPVIGTQVDNKWEYQFVLPEQFTLENAPQPTNPDVEVKRTEPKMLAVIEYSGLWREKTKEKNQAKLEQWIEEKGMTAIANPMIAGYDPPWTIPFLRRNEILIEVKAPEQTTDQE